MNNKILEKLLDVLQMRYGNLNNKSGFYQRKGGWFSLAEVVEIIKTVDNLNRYQGDNNE